MAPLDIFPLPSIFVNYKNIWYRSKKIEKERTFRLFEIESNEERQNQIFYLLTGIKILWLMVVKLIISRITYEGETSEY